MATFFFLLWSYHEKIFLIRDLSNVNDWYWDKTRLVILVMREMAPPQVQRRAKMVSLEYVSLSYWLDCTYL